MSRCPYSRAVDCNSTSRTKSPNRLPAIRAKLKGDRCGGVYLLAVCCSRYPIGPADPSRHAFGSVKEKSFRASGFEKSWAYRSFIPAGGSAAVSGVARRAMRSASRLRMGKGLEGGKRGNEIHPSE